MAPKCSAEMMSRKALIFLTEKICVLDKLHSVTGYCAVGHELSATESTICIKQGVVKQKYIKLCINSLTKM